MLADALVTLRLERALSAEAPRPMLARHILVIVAAFAGDTDTFTAALDGALSLRDGELEHDAAERMIRDLASQAERSTLHVPGQSRSGEVVCAILGEEELLSDYLRIVAATQNKAFGHAATDAELDARQARRRVLAREASEMARFRAEQKRADLHVCVCTHGHAEHRLRQVRGCSKFRDVEEASMRRAGVDLAATAMSLRAERAGAPLDARQHEVGHQMLRALVAERGGFDVSVGDALATIATALDIPALATA